jgi:hypothetical protein
VSYRRLIVQTCRRMRILKAFGAAPAAPVAPAFGNATKEKVDTLAAAWDRKHWDCLSITID